MAAPTQVAARPRQNSWSAPEGTQDRGIAPRGRDDRAGDRPRAQAHEQRFSACPRRLNAPAIVATRTNARTRIVAPASYSWEGCDGIAGASDSPGASPDIARGPRQAAGQALAVPAEGHGELADGKRQQRRYSCSVQPRADPTAQRGGGVCPRDRAADDPQHEAPGSTAPDPGTPWVRGGSSRGAAARTQPGPRPRLRARWRARPASGRDPGPKPGAARAPPGSRPAGDQAPPDTAPTGGPITMTTVSSRGAARRLRRTGSKSSLTTAIGHGGRQVYRPRSPRVSASRHSGLADASGQLPGPGHHWRNPAGCPGKSGRSRPGPVGADRIFRASRRVQRPPPMIARVARCLALLVVAIAAAGCASAGASGAPSLGRSFHVDATLPEASQTVTQTQLPASILDPIIDEVGRDAGVPREQVRVMSAEALTFPNGGLGCEVPGMAYTQVQVDGYRVVLEAGGVSLRLSRSRERSCAALPATEGLTPDRGMNRRGAARRRPLCRSYRSGATA